MAMSVKVSKSLPVVVRPSEPAVTTSNSIIKLSSFDKGYINVSITSLFVFEQPMHEPAETIKRALSLALVHYYPISGRIIAAGADHDDGELHIRCAVGEGGVPFVAASANSDLKQAKLSGSGGGGAGALLLDELAVYYDAAAGCGPGPSNPLMMVQVTEFSCGGFVVGVTWNHAVADGDGMAQFLQAVGEVARGRPSPSVVPVRRDDSLPSLPPSTVALQQLVASLEPLDLACLDVTIPSSAINRIRDEYGRVRSGSGTGGQQPCTTFEVVTAVLWQCRTRAIMSSSSDLSIPAAVLSFGVNLRRHVGAKEGYYGNCSSGQLVMATGAAVANGDIVEVIDMIKLAKARIPHQFVDKGPDETQQQKQQQVAQAPVGSAAGSAQQLRDCEARYNMFVVSSWRNIGFEEIDFGSGTPARVMSHSKPTASTLPLCVACLPWKSADGANVLSLCVKKEHADAFLGEIAKFA